jgi:hypothetical protein
MSAKAKKLLKQAVKVYLEEDGATELGSYRDAFTDLLHMAKKDRAIMKKAWDDPYIYLKTNLVNDAFEAFVEESESIENALIAKLKTKNLPLHLDDKFHFDSSCKLFDERLKSNT